MNVSLCLFNFVQINDKKNVGNVIKIQQNIWPVVEFAAIAGMLQDHKETHSLKF